MASSVDRAELCRYAPPPHQMQGREADQNAYRAAWSRVVLGALGLTLAPYLTPGGSPQRLTFAAYLVCALFVQFLIKRDIGGSARAFGGGLIDLAMLTFLVWRTGSASTSLVAVYVFIGLLNTMVSKPWVARALALLGWLAYVSVVVAETLGVLPYAPDAAAHIRESPPAFIAKLTSVVIVGILLGLSTYIVSRLLSAIRAREQELVTLNAQLEALSHRDPLTQLFNRRYLLDRIDLELARVRRGHAAALLMIDLDHFKVVNDTHGHLRGDDVLRRVADAIAGTVRATDVAGRYGGDEFAVLLSDTEPKQARVAAERLVKSVRDSASAVEPDGAVTASVGIAVAAVDDDSRSLLRRADENSYRAKERGGNCVCDTS